MRFAIGASVPAKFTKPKAWRFAWPAELTRIQAEMIAARARGNDPVMRAAWDRFCRRVWEIEPEVQAALDNWLIVRQMMARFGFEDKQMSNAVE